MISGQVNEDLEAVVNVRIRGKRIETTIDVIVDTGFSEYLTLYPSTIADLELEYIESTPVQFADGRFDRVHVYYAQIMWDGNWRKIFVQASDGDILGGMLLMSSCSLAVDIVIGGEVSITPLQ